jgi:DNA-directed RNA polymerase specialized sigma24 family protein
VIPPDRSLFPDTPPELFSQRERARRTARAHAVAKFCQLYWKPLLGLLVARKIEPAEAEDLVQGFLLRFLESDAIVRVDRAKGRFRDFLKGALHHYLIDERARAQTQKRGGASISFSLDEPGLAETLDLPCANHAHLSHADRIWAETLLNAALDRLEWQYADGNHQLFHLLRAYLIGAEPPSYEKLARRLHRSPATLRSDVKRLREKFRENLREELRCLVGPERLEQEWETLREILRGC